MGITHVYQPDALLAGKVARDAGYGQFLQDQARFNLQGNSLAEQARQFDLGLNARLQQSAQDRGFAAYQADQQRAFAADQSAQDWAGRYGLAAMNIGAQRDAQQRQIGAQFALNEQQQNAIGNRQLAEYAYRTAAEQQQQKFQRGMNAQQAIEDYASQGMFPSQAAYEDARGQWERQYGMPYDFPQRVLAERDTEAQAQALQANVDSLMQGAGLAPGIPASAFMGPDKNGQMVYQPELAINYAVKMAAEQRQAEKNRADVELERAHIADKAQQKAEADAEKQRVALQKSVAELNKFAFDLNEWHTQKNDDGSNRGSKPNPATYGFPVSVIPADFATFPVGSYFTEDGVLYKKVSPTDGVKVPY